MLNRFIRRVLILALLTASAVGIATPAHAAPGAPTSVTVLSSSLPNSPIESASVTVSWAIDSATEVSVVTVTRLSDSVVLETKTITSPAAQTGFDNLQGGENYAFEVTSVDLNGDTASASPVNFVAKSVPSLPTNPVSTPDIGQATLTWTPPSNNGGSALETYTITSISLTDTQSAAITPSGSETSVVVTGLTAGSAYIFKIRANNATGRTSEVVFPSVSIPTTPSAPVAPTAILLTGSTVRVTWSAPATGGSPITSFNIYTYSTDSGTPLVQTDSATASATTKDITLPTGAGHYKIKVAALNILGLGAKSDLSPQVDVTAASAPNISLTGSQITAYVSEPITSYAVSNVGGTPDSFTISNSTPSNKAFSSLSGLQFDTSTGVISGTPTAAQTQETFTVTAANTTGSSAATFSIVILARVALSTTQDSATVAITLGRSTSFKPVSGSGGQAPLRYAITPSLPAGLVFDTATGIVSGTASETRTATIETVTVTDSVTASSSKTFALTVNPAVSTTLDSATVVIYTGTTLPGPGIRPVSTVGGTTPKAFAISPALANGLSFDTSTGYITGTTTGTLLSRAETVTVTDVNGSTSSKSFTLEIRPNTVTSFAISGVTPPISGATPVDTVTAAQYTGTVSWSPSVASSFAASTIYTATITLTANPGYTFLGVAADSFTVTGSTSDTNTANSGVIYAVFPATGAAAVVIAARAIAGVTVPVRGETPTATLTATDSYTATIAWDSAGVSGGLFKASSVETATITLAAKAGYTLTGVTADFFTVSGAVATNNLNSGVITAVFPATAAAPISLFGIGGVTPPVRGVNPATSVTETAQYTGTISWSPGVGIFFQKATVYTATITLTAKPGYTFAGVAADSFTVAGSTSDTNSANSGVIYAIFPVTSDAPLSISAIEGVSAPVRGATPVSEVTQTPEYTGTVTWSPAVVGTFSASTAYTATITLSPKLGYTVTGISPDYFTVSGATTDTNTADSGVIYAVFPATEAAPVVPGPVTPAPTPVAPTPIITSPTEPATLTTNPNNATSVVLVIPGLSTYTAKPITVLVPAGASTTALTIKIAPTATSADATVGYISIDVTALSGSTAVTTFAQPLQITIPAGPVGSTISWSNDGLTWTTIPQLTSSSLASGQSDGFYVNSDGTISIFTRHLTQFGFKKAQSALVISPSATTIQIGKKAQLTITAGSGTGAISYATSTSNICSVNTSGEVTAIAAGTCQITVSKAASGIYTMTTGASLLTVSDSDQKAAAAEAEAAARAAAAAEAAAKELAQAIAAKNSIRIAYLSKGSWKISVDLADNKSGMMVEILIGELVGKKVVYKKVATGTLSSTATLTRSVKAKLAAGSMIKVVSGGKSLFTRTL